MTDIPEVPLKSNQINVWGVTFIPSTPHTNPTGHLSLPSRTCNPQVSLSVSSSSVAYSSYSQPPSVSTSVHPSELKSVATGCVPSASKLEASLRFVVL